jgi:biopolymer transport protein ExbD
MAGVDVGGGGGGRAGRKAVDSEINMIPMIDLLMVTISFLLITAVWTHMARVDANAQVPGRPDAPTVPAAAEKELEVDMRAADKFVLVWKQGSTTVESIDVPRQDVVESEGVVDVVRYPELGAKLESEWRAKGQHTNPTDTRSDRAILYADNATQFKYVVGVLDALHRPRRDMIVGGKAEKAPAFSVTFAAN